MNHLYDLNDYNSVNIGARKIYVDSYEVSRDRKMLFRSYDSGGLESADAGVYPLYIKINGFLLSSENAHPPMDINSAMLSGLPFDLNFNGVIYSQTRIKSFRMVRKTASSKISCELLLCCTGSVTEAMTA